jgi:hypothetical protein
MEDTVRMVFTAVLCITSPTAYPVLDRKNRISHILLERGLRERRNVFPDPAMLGAGISLEMTS